MTPEELALLQQQQEAGTVPPVEVSTGSGILPAIHDTLFDPAQKTDLSSGIMTDVDGIPQITPQPTEHDKLAAAQVVLGTAGQGQPETVNQKTGKTTTATTTTVQSQASKDAAAGVGVAQEEAQKATDMELKSVADQAKIDSDLKEADAKAISGVETARVLTQQQNQLALQNTMSDIDSRVAELTNYKPATFWGSKSQSDKISAAISVGLGSFAQALLGSKENVGQILLQRQMDEFDTNQKAQYDAKLAAITNMRADVQVKRQLAEDLDKTFDSQRLAARAQVQGQFARASAMAKTPQVQAAILQKQSKIDMEAAKIKEEIAAKHEAKITSTVEKDTLERIKKTAGMGPDGKPIKLTDGNAKARMAYADIAAANQSLAGIDLNKVSTSPAFQTYLESKNNETNLNQVPMLGSALVGIGNVISGTNEQYLAKNDPVAAQAANAMDSWTRGVIRYKSGAAIAHREQNEERNQYWPALGDTPETIKEKAAARAEIEQAMRQAGAL